MAIETIHSLGRPEAEARIHGFVSTDPVVTIAKHSQKLHWDNRPVETLVRFIVWVNLRRVFDSEIESDAVRYAKKLLAKV